MNAISETRPGAATYYSVFASAIGELLLRSDGERLTALFLHPAKIAPEQQGWRRDDSRFAAAREQLAAYFAGELKNFDLPLACAGTAFQREVWNALLDIPFGSTVSYGTQAARIGKPNAARAVGLANGQNPIAIIVPCHRVIGASGALTGYGGGLERKQWLLRHEGALLI